MTDTFWGFINLVITDSPSFLLMYYPFRGRLKCKPRWVIALNGGILLLAFGVYFLTAEQYLSFSFLQAHKAILAIPCVVIALFVIEDNKFKILYFIAIMLAYLNVATKAGNSIAYYLYKDPSYFQFDIVNFVVIILTVPLMLHFTNSILMRTDAMVDAVNADIWKTIWVIPTLFLFLSFAFNYNFNQSLLADLQFLVINFLTVAGVFISSDVLLKTMRHAAENAALKEKARMTDQQLILQGDQYKMLTENIGKTKVARHDLRHQLTVLKSYGSAGDLQKLNAYLDELTGGVKNDDEDILLCNNYAMNAIAQHYLSIAKSEGIEVDVRLDVPEKTGQVPDMDLCIIMGNLLENALEACRRMQDGQRFIRARSKVENDYISITVDNSFDGVWREHDGVYLSRKHEGEGIGLRSVRAVTEKYDGLAEFRVEGNTFLSSALVTMSATSNVEKLCSAIAK